MKKRKIARIYALERKLTTLKKIKCPSQIKRKLRKAAKDWIAWINQHMEDLQHPPENFYHEGEINILELFFNIKRKKDEKSNCKNLKWQKRCIKRIAH